MDRGLSPQGMGMEAGATPALAWGRPDRNWAATSDASLWPSKNKSLKTNPKAINFYRAP
jgi:hypothetical protein